MDKLAIDYIKSDVYRYYGKCNIMFIIRCFFNNPLIRFHVALRMCQRKLMLGRLLWKFNKKRQYIQLSPYMEIGYGLYIGHGGPIIVNSSAKIGNNVNLSPFTVIGSNMGKAATIGDNVYIGPNCCLVEDVVIGNNVTIGAGSVVTKNIPDNATACGNYAKVINFNNPGRFVGNRWRV